jgi:ABC-type bacteriocin/lantibiotic exporter with double-glycine peptidase domain
MKSNNQQLLRFFEKEKWSLFLFTSLAVLKGFVLVPLPLIFQQLIESLTDKKHWQTSVVLLVALFLINGLSVVLAVISQAGVIRVVKKVIHALRNELAKKIIYSPHNIWKGRENLYKDALVQETERLDIALTVGLGQVLPAIISASLLCLLIFTLSPLLTLISLFLFPISIGLLMQSKQKVVMALTQFKDAFTAFDTQSNFAIRSWELIKTQTAEQVEEKKQKAVITRVHRVSQLLAIQQIYLQGLQDGVGVVFSVGLLGLGFFFSSIERLSITEVVVFFVGFSLMRMQLNTIVSGWTQVVAFGGAVTRIQQLLLPTTTPYTGKKKIKPSGKLELSNVSFSHGTKKVLNNASVTIEPHTLTVITGENGEGKTSLLSIALGLTAPSTGEVLIDDIPLTKLDVIHYRQHIGVVSQQPLFTEGTIQENIIYGSSLTTHKSKKDYLSWLKLDAFINCSQQVSSLSGGEKQRLALLRALKRKPCLLFLDEPTNHLDVESKQLFLKHLSKLLSATTVVCITHDPDLIALADVHYHLRNSVLTRIKTA